MRVSEDNATRGGVSLIKYFDKSQNSHMKKCSLWLNCIEYRRNLVWKNDITEKLSEWKAIKFSSQEKSYQQRLINTIPLPDFDLC